MNLPLFKPHPTQSKPMRICHVSFWRLIALLLALATALCVLLLCKKYINIVLIWLENQEPVLISLCITFLFVVVALPVGVGYIVLVIAEGYLFGLVWGLVLTIVEANVGLVIAHRILKVIVVKNRSVQRIGESDLAVAIRGVISGPLCFKIVICSRLTPIPFGLQNTIFALSNVNLKLYHLASFLGLLPGQLIGVYAGSTLRSMQDVLELENQSLSGGTMVFIVGQLILAVGLMVWFGNKARGELLRALAKAQSDQMDVV